MQRHLSRNRRKGRPLSRRSFLRSSVVGAGAATIGMPAILRGENLNERLNVAIIGAGGRGAANLSAVESENIVALCDVNEANLDAAAERHPKARVEDVRLHRFLIDRLQARRCGVDIA